MVVYIAVDKNNGMMFNNRRQSQDRIMRQQMLDDCEGRTLWIHEYSKKLFVPNDGSDFPTNIIVDNDFLNKAGEEDGCFVENCNIAEWMDKVDKVVLFKWNREYPADFFFDISLLDNNWKKFSVNKFVGSSHDKIIKEVWKRA